MVKDKKCDCKINLLTVYGRSQGANGTWTSSKNITGHTIYICSKCGKIFRDKIEEVID